MRVSERYPRFAGGFVCIDDRDAPSLRNAVGSRIYLTRPRAEARADLARRGLAPDEAAHLRVVPVEGPSEVFAVDYLDCEGVSVGANGYLSMEAWAAKGVRR